MRVQVLSLVALGVAVVGLAACSDPTGAACGPARSLDPALRIAPVTGGFRTIDDEAADIARQVPGGWGGLFLQNGTPVIYLVQPERRDEAVAALHALGVGGPTIDVRQAQVLQGRWDFAQLYDWYRWINGTMPYPPGLVYTDIDEVTNRLGYGVLASGRDSLVALLATLDLPCDLVTIEVTSAPVPQVPGRLATPPEQAPSAAH